MTIGEQLEQTEVTVKGVGQPETRSIVVEAGQIGHVDVAVSVELVAGIPGAMGGQVGQAEVTI